LATQAGEMALCPVRKISLKAIKLVQSRWLDIGLVLFGCLWALTPFWSINVQKKKKKELGQYPAILTLRLVDNPYIYVA